jgi:pilus assembly protein CpaE
MSETTVAVGIEAPTLQESVFRFLESFPRLRVGPGLARTVRTSEPDAVVVCTSILSSEPDLHGSSVVVVGERETTAGLRAALRVGARGFFLWPEEREAMGRVMGELRGRPAADGRVIAVFGPRGGAGTTFLATHLAAACSSDDRRLVLADLDLDFAGVTTALGLPSNGGVRTLADVAPAADDLSPDELRAVLQPHPRGFSVLLAPSHPGRSPEVGAEGVRSIVRIMRSACDLVVLHLPGSLDDASLAAMEVADTVLLVVTLDVLAFRAAHRALEALRAHELEDRCRLVVNRARRAEIVPEDAERVFGLAPVAVIPVDPAVPRAQDRGELLTGRRSRAARRVAELAGSLVAEDTK